MLESLKKDYLDLNHKILSKKVYDWLIKPIEAELKNRKIKNLVFILDGKLRQIPMATLYDGEKYLLEKYGISLTPGLQLINSKSFSLSSSQRNFNVLAAVVSEEQRFSGQIYSPIEPVKEEFETIEKKLPTNILLNQFFTKSNLLDPLDLYPFNIFHISTHGRFSSNLENTYLVAWKEYIKIRDLENILNTTQEIDDHHIKLLILTACETDG